MSRDSILIVNDPYIMTPINTSAFCIKYETLLLSCSMALLSNPINKFIRYTAVNKENRTIIMARNGLSLISQLDIEFGSPVIYYINRTKSF